MFADYHVHSEFSDDSTYPIEQVVKDAIAMQINEICFTDHVDYPNYYSKIRQLQSQYNMQISIKLGMEFGIQTHTIPQYEILFQKYPFDFILLSIHQVEDKEFWTQDFQNGKSQKEYNEQYYKEMLNIVKIYKNYSVLAHLDLITRYDRNGIYPFEKVEPIILEILKIIIKDKKGIEFNTSYYRYGLKDFTPSINILKLYQKLGGEIITIGSDSHKPEHLGNHIIDAKNILKNLGFQSFCTYDKMQPIYHSL